MYVSRVFAFFSAAPAVTVGPVVLWSGRCLQLCTSTAPTGAASAPVIASMVGGVSELKGLDLGEESLHM